MIRLASGSQTRAMLLESADIEFVQESVDFDEDSIVASSPKNFVYQATNEIASRLPDIQIKNKFEINLKEIYKKAQFMGRICFL